jgi:drug/metabolite transporter, DME family
MALLIGTGLLWGTIGVVSKAITENGTLDPVSITWLRSVVAAPVCLVAAWMAMGATIFRGRPRDLLFMVGLGGVLVFYQWFYLEGIARIGVSAATLISLCGAPVVDAVASSFSLGEPLSRPVVLSLAGAIAGTILLIGQPATGSGTATATGVLFSVACAAGIAGHVIGLRSITHRVHPLQTLAIGFPIGAIVFAPIALARGVSFEQPVVSWLLLIYLGVVPSSLASLFYQRGLQEVPATMASIVTMLEPLVAAILAWIFFAERLGLCGWIGGALLIGSIGLLTRHANRSRQPAPLTDQIAP